MVTGTSGGRTNAVELAGVPGAGGVDRGQGIFLETLMSFIPLSMITLYSKRLGQAQIFILALSTWPPQNHRPCGQSSSSGH